MAEQFRGGRLDPYYAGYFELFNKGQFYEAHDVLEHLWLKDKHGPDGNFYKGLIQLAGAFVHLQKNRLRPAAALFKLALANLEKYPGAHKNLALNEVRDLARNWLGEAEGSAFQVNPLTETHAPHIELTRTGH